MGFFNKINNSMIVDALGQLPDRGDGKIFGTNVSLKEKVHNVHIRHSKNMSCYNSVLLNKTPHWSVSPEKKSPNDRKHKTCLHMSSQIPFSSVYVHFSNSFTGSPLITELISK